MHPDIQSFSDYNHSWYVAGQLRCGRHLHSSSYHTCHNVRTGARDSLKRKESCSCA